MNKGGKGGMDNNSNNDKNELKWCFLYNIWIVSS
jgi:hypothetical protein